jgi:uncharacterized protein YqcC (DUF446 family)
MPASPQAVAAQVDQIEAELRRIGMWQEAPLPDEAYEFNQAFAMDTMAFSQWLQFVFLPRVRSLIEEGGDFPAGSEVAVQAVREFDGHPDAGQLLTLLSDFDDLF